MSYLMAYSVSNEANSKLHTLCESSTAKSSEEQVV